jgi:hypothetical protein
MDEELSDSMLLHALENLPSFGGQRNEDVNKWLEAITNGLNFVGLNDNHKVRLIHTYLTGDARRMIINNMAVLNEWTSCVQLIRRTYDSSFQNQVVIPQVNEVQQDSSATIIQREHVVIESFDIIEGQKTSVVEDKETVELIQEEEEVVELIQEEEEEVVEFIQEEEEEAVNLVQEETAELIQEEEEEAVNLVQEETAELIQGEEKDAKNLDDFITPSFQNEKVLNKTVDDNDGLLSTNILQAYENVDSIIHLLLMTVGKHQLIKTIDITRLKNIFSTCQNNGSTDTSTYLKNGTNRQTLWYNFSPYKTNLWEWFRTLAVP